MDSRRQRRDVKAVSAAGYVASGVGGVGVLGLYNVGERDEGQSADVVGIEGAVATCVIILNRGGRREEAGGGCVERGGFGAL